MHTETSYTRKGTYCIQTKSRGRSKTQNIGHTPPTPHFEPLVQKNFAPRAPNFFARLAQTFLCRYDFLAPVAPKGFSPLASHVFSTAFPKKCAAGSFLFAPLGSKVFAKCILPETPKQIAPLNWNVYYEKLSATLTVHSDNNSDLSSEYMLKYSLKSYNKK